MADIATLAIKVENGDVPKATASLDALTVAGTKSEAAAQRLTRRMALLEIEARGMDASMGKSHLSLVHLAEGMGLGETAAAKLMKTLGALGALAVVGLIGHKVVEESIAAQNAMAQLEAAVDSTGGVAGRTAEQLEALSMKLQQQTTFSHEAVQGAEALLLSFDKIHGTQFDEATKAVTDLATRMGGDLQGAAIKVGKALQDPEHGLAALRKAGISFSTSQIEVIKDLYDTGRVAQAQEIILKGLEQRFGGAGAAARDTLGGALAFLKNQWNDLFEVSKSSSTGIVQAINAMGEALPEIRSAFNAFFGGIALLSVDAAVAWQKFLNLFRREAGLNDALDKWKEEQYALITGTNGATDALGHQVKQVNELTDAQRKFQALTGERQAELGKLNALNAAYGQSALTLAIVALKYDAMIQKSKDAKDHHGAELVTLNKLTDAILKQKIAQAELADQQARTDRLRATQRERLRC
jgi:phage-related minor tail protein